MATHSSILAWKISWTEEPGWVQPMGHKESGMTDLLTLTYLLKGIKMLIFLECLLGARYFHSLLFILTKILCGRR